jgi:hypothetical protein
MRKLIQSYNRLVDHHLTSVLLRNIKPVDINNSEYIFIFNPVRGRYFEKLYILISHQLAQKGVPSFFVYKNDLLQPYYPSLHIDGHEISNSIILKNKQSIIHPLGENQLYFDWIIDLTNNRLFIFRKFIGWPFFNCG